jgi:proteasome lid subunit RPN8/RPN11
VTRQFRLLRSQLNAFISDAVAADRYFPGTEVCGLLVDNGYFLHLYRASNKVKKGGGYAFYVNEIRRIEKAVTVLGYEVVGTFHSHPSYIAEPGREDVGHVPDDSYMLVVDVMLRRARLWLIKDLQVRPLSFVLLGPRGQTRK